MANCRQLKQAPSILGDGALGPTALGNTGGSGGTHTGGGGWPIHQLRSCILVTLGPLLAALLLHGFRLPVTAQASIYTGGSQLFVWSTSALKVNYTVLLVPLALKL